MQENLFEVKNETEGGGASDDSSDDRPELVLCSQQHRISKKAALFASDVKMFFNQFRQCDQADVHAIRNAALSFDVPPNVAKAIKPHLLTVHGECPGYKDDRCVELNLDGELQQGAINTLASVRLRSEYSKTAMYPSLKDRNWVKQDTNNTIPDILPFDDVVITLEVHHPFSCQSGNKFKVFTPIVQQEIRVLGRQTLDQFRDVITCPNHFMKAGDLKNKSYHDVPFGKDLYLSGFFYFENTFYNDTRNQTNIDYSEVIRNWAKLPETRSPFEKINMKTAIMEKTRFQDLKIRFGYPYVYQHLGNCEHIIVFLQAKLIDHGDDLCSSSYPLQSIPHNKEKNHMCIMCGSFVAKWIVVNNKRVPHNPSFFCHSCHMSFNYISSKDEPRVKGGDFIEHPLIDLSQVNDFKRATYDIRTDPGYEPEESPKIKKVKKSLSEMTFVSPLFTSKKDFINQSPSKSNTASTSRELSPVPQLIGFSTSDESSDDSA